jgi:phenylalanyl-tRNA synthetase beta chain
MIAQDFVEALNYAFVDATLLSSWQVEEGAVVLANALSSELGVMRTMLLPGLAAAMQRNHARQLTRVRLFELGRVFHATGDAPRETQRIAAIAMGPARPEQWSGASVAVDFADLKSPWIRPRRSNLTGVWHPLIEFRMVTYLNELAGD